MASMVVYLAAAVDWFSRKVLAWRLSITLSADFCIEALEEALTHTNQMISNRELSRSSP
jgi:putative transposase